MTYGLEASYLLKFWRRRTHCPAVPANAEGGLRDGTRSFDYLPFTRGHTVLARLLTAERIPELLRTVKAVAEETVEEETQHLIYIQTGS